MSTSRATKKNKSQKQKTGVGSHPLRSRLMESKASGSLLRCVKTLKGKENQALFTDTKTWWSRLENRTGDADSRMNPIEQRREGLHKRRPSSPCAVMSSNRRIYQTPRRKPREQHGRVKQLIKSHFSSCRKIRAHRSSGLKSPNCTPSHSIIVWLD